MTSTLSELLDTYEAMVASKRPCMRELVEMLEKCASCHYCSRFHFCLDVSFASLGLNHVIAITGCEQIVKQYPAEKMFSQSHAEERL